MFRATILPIFRSFRLCNTACGMLYAKYCRPAAYWLWFYFVCPLEYPIKKPPVPHEASGDQFNKVKSWNELLQMLLVCIRTYLKSVPSYNLLILDTYHPDILYLHEQGCEDPWLFFEARRDPWAKKFWKHWPKVLHNLFYALVDRQIRLLKWCASRPAVHSCDLSFHSK
jgi:hypothetical protein